MTDSLRIENARIWTGLPAAAWAHSIRISDGRICSIDTTEPGTRTIDAGGRTITPGLIDTHTHLLMGGLALDELDLSAVRSRAEFEAAIAARHAELPPDRWLIARGWTEENWGGEKPTKHWLRAAGDRPVVCHRIDIHASLVNDAVLRQIELPPSIPGGLIVRDANEPTGLMVEAAAWKLVNPVVPSPAIGEHLEALRRAQSLSHELGLTAIGGMEYQAEIESVYERLREELTLRCRLTVLDREWPMDFAFASSFNNDDCLAGIGYKAFADGTLGSRTARMLQPYSDDPGNQGEFIELARDGHLRDWARAVADAGLSPSIHAIGDAAARLALDAIDRLPDSARPRIEHAQQIDPGDLPRFAGVFTSMQPLHKADDGMYLERRVGRERLAGSFAFRSLLDHGARVAFGSDWPVVSPDPMLGIRAAVTGQIGDGSVFLPEQNLNVEEAMRAYTAEAAAALGMSDAGVLRPGAYADLVMYDRDPFTVDWARELPRVILTMAGGEVVFDRREAHAC